MKPNGIIEVVFDQVDKFTLPGDFISLDMVEYEEVLIIFGKPSLATRDAVIGIKDKINTFWINRESVTLDVNHAMRYPRDDMDYFRVDVIDDYMTEIQEDEMCAKADAMIESLNMESLAEFGEDV